MSLYVCQYRMSVVHIQRIGSVIVSIYLYLSVYTISIYRYYDIYRRLVLSITGCIITMYYYRYYYYLYYYVLSIYITMYILLDILLDSIHAVQSLGGIDTKLASNHIWLSLSV